MSFDSDGRHRCEPGKCRHEQLVIIGDRLSLRSVHEIGLRADGTPCGKVLGRGEWLDVAQMPQMLGEWWVI
jgi:hypothetical protein